MFLKICAGILILPCLFGFSPGKKLEIPKPGQNKSESKTVFLVANETKYAVFLHVTIRKIDRDIPLPMVTIPSMMARPLSVEKQVPSTFLSLIVKVSQPDIECELYNYIFFEQGVWKLRRGGKEFYTKETWSITQREIDEAVSSKK
jgi:hypothetical protein